MPDKNRTPAEIASARHALRFIGAWLRFRKLTQGKLANRLATSEPTVSKWLSGKQGMSIEQFLQVAVVLEASPAELLGSPVDRERSRKYDRLASALGKLPPDRLDKAVDALLVLVEGS